MSDLRMLAFVSLVGTIAITLSGCSPDDVPAGGHPPLETEVHPALAEKQIPQEPLEVYDRLEMSLPEAQDVTSTSVGMESPARFVCTASMEDQLVRSGAFCSNCGDKSYRLLRYYRFSLQPGLTTVHLSQLDYKKLAASGNLVYQVNQDLQVDSPDTEISMSLRKDPETGENFMRLSVRASQKLGKFIVANQSQKEFHKDIEDVSASSQIHVQSLAKKLEDIDLDRGDKIELGDTKVIVESRTGAKLQLESFQVKNTGAVKTVVECEITQ